MELGKTKQQRFVWVNTRIGKTTRKGLVRKGALGKTLPSVKLQCLLLVAVAGTEGNPNKTMTGLCNKVMEINVPFRQLSSHWKKNKVEYLP